MELGSSFFLLHFHVCKAQRSQGESRALYGKSSFGSSTAIRVGIKTCTLKLRKSEKRAEGKHKEECVRLAPFEEKSLA